MAQETQRILIVDDEAPLRDIFAKGLSRNGYSCDTAGSAEEANTLLRVTEFDLVLLDISMPGKTGLSLLATLSKSFPDMAIIMVSGNDDLETATFAMRQGADDYLAKPFKFIELIARVKSLLRRSRNFNSNIPDNSYRFSDIKVNDSSKTVTRNGKKIALTSTEYKLLLAFLKAPGRVISRTELLENVWGVNYDIGTNVVDVYVNYLRKKLEKENNERLIHTVIGMGYVLKEDDEDTE